MNQRLIPGVGLSRGMGRSVVLVGLLIFVFVTGCDTSVGHGSQQSESSAVADRKPLPAGASPSRIAKMVCATEAQEKIAAVIGSPAVVDTPTWSNHLYSCRYIYPHGSMTLSVKELSSWPKTFSYFAGLGLTLGKTRSLYNLGQGAFQVRSNSVVVRKDWKVLLVDVTNLPQQIGSPPSTPSNVALDVADLILGCWSGD
jgi:hypothetical protein